MIKKVKNEIERTIKRVDNRTKKRELNCTIKMLAKKAIDYKHSAVESDREKYYECLTTINALRLKIELIDLAYTFI